MNRLPKLLLVGSLGLVAGAVQARDCEVDLHYGITLEPKQVVLQDGNTVFVLADGALSRDGKAISLSAKEQEQLRQYEAGVRELVPQVSAITREAVAIAGEATEFAFATLLGPEHDSVQQLRGKFANLGVEISKRIDDQHLPARATNWRDEDWNVVGEGASISWDVAEASFALVGKALHAAFDEDYAKQWERQLEDMETELEKRVEARAALLETKAEALCDNVTALQALESSLSASNSALKAFDIVRRDH